MNTWADLHGEDDNKKPLSALDVLRIRKGVYCRNCEFFVEFADMNPFIKDDDTIDLMCPDCDTVLVEGE